MVSQRLVWKTSISLYYKYVYIDDCHENFGRFVAGHNL